MYAKELWTTEFKPSREVSEDGVRDSEKVDNVRLKDLENHSRRGNELER